MVRLRSNSGIKFAYRLLVLQTIIVFLASMILVMLQKGEAAKSLLIGGAICILPNLYFAYKFFAHWGATAAKQIVHTFYKAEAVKIMLSGILFLLVFKWLPVSIFAVFMGYLLAQAGFWLSPFMLMRK